MGGSNGGTLKISALASEVISFMRFPMIFAVLLIHTGFNLILEGRQVLSTSDFSGFEIFTAVLGEGVALAVPLFFFFSGCLFFCGRAFSGSVYKEKMKKRFRTLFIPYVFWNLLYIGVYFLAQTAMPSLVSGNTKAVADFSLSDWLSCFWIFHEDFSSPIAVQFWFIRDLMCIMPFTPVLYMIIRKLHVWFVAALAVYWIIDDSWCTSLFFFSAGAVFSVKGWDFADLFSRWKTVATVVFVLIVSIVGFCYDADLYRLHKVNILFGMVAVVGWCACGVQAGKLRASALLAGCSFFVFAYHQLPILLANKLFVSVLHPDSSAVLIMGKLLIPALIALAGIGLYVLLKKWWPAFLSWTCGGR